MSDVTSWVDICPLSDIPKNTGVCADFNGQQVAIFHLSVHQNDHKSEVKAVNNFDPFSRANILSRGLITETEDKYCVASPLLKQQFCLDSGVCQQDETISIATYQSRIADGVVQLGA